MTLVPGYVPPIGEKDPDKISRAIRNLYEWADLANIVNVKLFGAKGDWDGSTGTDDAAAFQRAIDYVYDLGGGVVYVPPVEKAYRWNSSVHLKSGVRLLGSNSLTLPTSFIEDFDDYYGGHCIAITWGSGTSTGMALKLSTNAHVMGLNFIYPGQATSHLDEEATEFPPTISGDDFDIGAAVECCYFVNSYKAIYFIYNHGELRIKSCWGLLLKAFITINGCISGDKIHDCQARGASWLRNSDDADYEDNTSLMAWIQENGIAFHIGRADAIHFTDCYIEQGLNGIRFGGAPSGGSTAGVDQYAYGSWVGGGIEGCTRPIYIAGSTSSGINSNGFIFANVGIAGAALFDAARSILITLDQPTTVYSDSSEYRGNLSFVGCTFWGTLTTTNVGPLDGVIDATGSDCKFIGCIFKDFETFIARAFSGTPILDFDGCTFHEYDAARPTYHFIAEAGAGGRIFLDGVHFKTAIRGAIGSGATTHIDRVTTPSVASAATVTLPEYGTVFTISGTTNIDSITASWQGRRVTLVFDGALTVGDASNLVLAGGFTTTANDSLTLDYVGSNWVEASRSVN
jgi:hypothetical protein